MSPLTPQCLQYHPRVITSSTRFLSSLVTHHSQLHRISIPIRRLHLHHSIAMLRRALPISTTITRAVRTQPQRLYSFRVRPVSRLETVAPFIRFNSTAPNVQSQQKLDWDAPKLSYEQVRARSEQPSPVRFLSFRHFSVG